MYLYVVVVKVLPGIHKELPPVDGSAVFHVYYAYGAYGVVVAVRRLHVYRGVPFKQKSKCLSVKYDYMRMSSYSLLPRPISSPCSICTRQLVLGWTLMKWSWQRHSASLSALLGLAGMAFTASAAARSIATGSKEANIPILGTIGASFSGWQSQLGEISAAMLMWKFGLSFTTA